LVILRSLSPGANNQERIFNDATDMASWSQTDRNRRVAYGVDRERATPAYGPRRNRAGCATPSPSA
jgi:hypothetical protein